MHSGKSTRFGILALAAFGLSGCMNSNTVVIASPHPTNTVSQEASRAAGKPCFLPADQKGAYATAVAVKSFSVRPERAKTEHVAGCASVKFRLNTDGTPHDVTTLAEYPPNYDFASALTESIKGSTYKPPISTDQWYYIMETIVFNPNVGN